MRKRNFLAVVLVAAMVLSLVACGGGENNTEPTSAPTSTTAPTTAPTAAPTDEPAPTVDPTIRDAASIDFEDGSMSFAALYVKPANADAAEMAIVDYNGSKALQVKSTQDKVPFVAFSVSALLGDKAADVASVEMTLGLEYADGTFHAASGQFILWTGADLVEYTADWSVYMASKNPKVAPVVLADVASKAKVDSVSFTADNNIIMLNVKDDSGLADGFGAATLYIDDICFFDAAGNLLTADSTVAFAAPDGFENSGRDTTNLYAVTNAVEFPGFTCAEGAWTQAGFDFTEEILAALVPGSVIEIEYTSEDGNIWIVLPDSAAGWCRVADGNAGGKSYINDSKSIAQITYEQIASVCGEDTSTWGARLQCEGSSAWEVFGLKVGTANPNYVLGNAVEFPGFACSEGAWTQAGFEFTQEILDALVPGTGIEISYTSEDGKMWIVLPDSAAGWCRVADGNAGGSSVCIDGVCYITYEQIVEVCGEDKTTWGARLQCESSSAWEVYALRVGSLNAIPAANNVVEFPGFTCAEGAWTQAGFDITEEIRAALVPGSALKISYTSEDGKMWIVLPDSTAGWCRVADGNAGGSSTCVDGVCYITYDQIVEVCGEDTAAWGARLQCESSSAWEVFALSVVGVQ